MTKGTPPICTKYRAVTDLVSIVFSYWKQSLNCVGRLLQEHGIVFCRVDGDLRVPDRKMKLKKFREDPSIRVLLMTLSTGGVG